MCVNKKWEIVYVSLMQERTKIRKNERKWLDKAMESEEKIFRFPWIHVCRPGHDNFIVALASSIEPTVGDQGVIGNEVAASVGFIA